MISTRSALLLHRNGVALAGLYTRILSRLLCFVGRATESIRDAGLEVTLLAAIPAGSGLGTSSILAATVLGALSDFCGLAWDKNEIGNRSADP